MKPFRKLRVVDCPQPQPPSAKPIVYGQAPWSRLPPSPPAHEISIRARAQSLLTRDGKRPELPDYETALRIIAAANRPRRCTVPEPLCQPAPDKRTTPPPGEPVRAGSQTLPTLAFDDEAGWNDYMRRAFAGEIEAF